ncbi:MAG: Fic family protein [Chlamydiota bacterium]
MGSEGEKMAVLRQLEQEGEPVTLRQLLQKLGTTYSERSVRRWLADMTTEGMVKKIGVNRGTKYATVKQAGVSNLIFSLESRQVLEVVQKPLYRRVSIAYSNEWLDNYQPNVTFYIPEECRKKLHISGKRLEKEDPAGTYAHQIFNRLLIDLSYNSSRLEGNTYSLLDTQKLLLEGAGAEGKLDEEKIMILNHKEAIRYLVDNATKLQINTQTICTLHYLLSDGLVEGKYAGKIRDHGVRIGGSTYVPFEDPRQLQEKFFQIIEKAALIKDPYEQSIFLLIHMSYLQAFTDVNKRTARLSANIPFIKYNLVPLSFNDVDRDDYISAMIAIYELQNINPILDLFMFSYLRTCSMYDSTVQSLGFDEVRVRCRPQRRSLIRDIIIKRMSGKKMEEYLCEEAKKLVDLKVLDSFTEDVLEDLKLLDLSRIVGLGITEEDLKEWIAVQEG